MTGVVRPYRERDCPPLPWWHIPSQLIPIGYDTLLPSQHPETDPHQLALKMAGGHAEGGDECLAVVEFRGLRYLHDGAHRRRRDLIHGKSFALARICVMDGESRWPWFDASHRYYGLAR